MGRHHDRAGRLRRSIGLIGRRGVLVGHRGTGEGQILSIPCFPHAFAATVAKRKIGEGQRRGMKGYLPASP